MAGNTAWKPATPQLSLVLPGAPASQFHSTVVERPIRLDQLQHLLASTFQCIFHDESQGR